MAEFEERADQLSLTIIGETLADGDIFRKARKKLLGKGAKLLVGPRGTGKTHLMRYTYKHALGMVSEPLPFYANFSRYLHLEPLLKHSSDALRRFHSWVVAKLLLAAFDTIHDAKQVTGVVHYTKLPHDEQQLRTLVSLLEQGGGDEIYESFGQHLTVNHVQESVEALTTSFGRSRAILLLDDAALALTDQYLVSFFEIFRLLKSEKIAPKASVYPGSTQYGPTFHVSHETEEVSIWLSVEDPDYLSIMGEIAERRFSVEELSGLSQDASELFRYVAFGVPRVYLRLLREYLDGKAHTTQQLVNRVISNQTSLIGAEYDSLQIKLRQFATVVATGRKFFDNAVAVVADAQSKDGSSRNIVLGLRQGSERSPLAERMLRFLVEVGMLYPLQPVSHGPNRRYDRYIPHLAFLRQGGAFKEGGRGSPLRELSVHMQRPATKHPVRRDLSTLLSATDIASLKLDLPPCTSCGTARINESQRFCHACGKELIASSLFEECMRLPLEQVPGITPGIIARIHKDTKIRTIGHVYSSQSASRDLQEASYVGPRRAGNIVDKVALVVNEFLS